MIRLSSNSLPICTRSTTKAKYLTVIGFFCVFALLWYINTKLDTNNNKQNSLWLKINEQTDILEVVVVEEHHEVIPHWVRMIERFNGLKAVVLHIDAHSDMDYPELVQDFPFGHIPRNGDEIHTLMQGNDMFIQSSILSNLTETIYVIYPSWVSYTNGAFNCTLGIVNINNQNQVCMCLSDDELHCKTRNMENTNQDDISISRDKCSKSHHFYLTELSSNISVNILKYSKNWSLMHFINYSNIIHPFILDIDEDFFGVHLVMRSLLNVNLSYNFIEKLNIIIQTLFCPNNINDEIYIDLWFHQLLELIEFKKLYTFRQINLFIDNLIDKLKTGTQYDWFCEKNLKSNLNKLINLLNNELLISNQIDALSRVGLCLTSSALTYYYKLEIHLCIGHNTPNASLVQEFTPSSDELTQLAIEFARILTNLPYKPNIITLCRSSRDGYTPRWMQMKIERLIINLLKKIFNLTETHIVYTENLAGGITGWYNRHS